MTKQQRPTSKIISNSFLAMEDDWGYSWHREVTCEDGSLWAQKDTDDWYCILEAHNAICEHGKVMIYCTSCSKTER